MLMLGVEVVTEQFDSFCHAGHVIGDCYMRQHSNGSTFIVRFRDARYTGIQKVPRY